jgi:hypothetical protein
MSKMCKTSVAMIVGLVAFVWLLAPARAAEPIGELESQPGVAVLVNPAALLFGLALGVAVVEPQIQVRLSDFIGLDLRPVFATYYGGWVDSDLWGGGASLGLRIAPGGRGLRGMYLVPRISLLYLEASSAGSSQSLTDLAPSLEIGYAWIWGAFVLNLGAGAGYHVVVSGADVYGGNQLGSFQILLNASIGFAI